MNRNAMRNLTLLSGLLLCLWHFPAQAARTFSNTQSPTAALAEYDMGTTQTLTYAITNTSGGGNVDERIYEVRFRLPGSGTVFSSATAAPAGWTRSNFSTTSVTFRATSWSTALESTNKVGAVITTASFNLVMVMRTTTADITETLSSIRSQYTLDTNFGNGIRREGRTTVNNPGSWTLRSLQITSFQTTDLSGTPISAVASGGSFRLVMTVKNNSSVTRNGIVSNPSPPTRNTLPGWSGNNPSCSLTGTSPSPLNLAPGASGTITYTCTTTGSGPNISNGAVYYTATARVSGSITSRSASSNVIAISPVTVSMAIAPTSPSCLFSGGTATFVLTVTNTTGGSLTNVSPSALTLTTANGAAYSALSGPTPSPCSIPATLGAGASCSYTWTATVTGTVTGLPKPGITASAFMNYTSGGSALVTPSTSDTEDVDDFVVSVSPASTNASSTNQELVWSATNYGCSKLLNQVAITVPAGWTAGSDSYSIVYDNSGNQYNENWTASGTTFSAPTLNDRIPDTRAGNFSVVFTSTPSATGTYNFSVTVTDDGGNSATHTTPVTVNAFGSGSLNQTSPGPWRENFQ